MAVPVSRYPLLSRVLHWLMLPLLLAQIALGLWAADLPLGMSRFIWLSRHKSLGMLMLMLVLVRLGWRILMRLRADLPPAAAVLSRRQQRLASGVQFSLYALMLLLPLSGWLLASAGKLPPSFFGWFNFPALLAPNEILQARLESFHSVLAWLFIGLIIMHSLAAIWHLYARDGVFARMALWQTRKSKE